MSKKPVACFNKHTTARIVVEVDEDKVTKPDKYFVDGLRDAIIAKLQSQGVTGDLSTIKIFGCTPAKTPPECRDELPEGELPAGPFFFEVPCYSAQAGGHRHPSPAVVPSRLVVQTRFTRPLDNRIQWMRLGVALGCGRAPVRELVSRAVFVVTALKLPPTCMIKGFAIRANGATSRAMIMVPRHETAMCDALLDWSLTLHRTGLLFPDTSNVITRGESDELALKPANVKDMNFAFQPFCVYRVRPHMRMLMEKRHATLETEKLGSGGPPVSEDDKDDVDNVSQISTPRSSRVEGEEEEEEEQE